ncbi:MAG: glycosyltransferase family 4 protein [Candidatus Woesearchaeota archaeon]
MKIAIKKKKLVIATDAFLPRIDGIGRFLLEIIPRIENDYDITIIAPNFKGEFNFKFKSNIIRCNLINFQLADTYFSYVKYKKIKNVIKEADLVFIQTIGPIGIKSIKIAKKYKKPIIAFIHILEWELIPNSLKRFKLIGKIVAKYFAKKYYNKCDLLIFPSEEMMYKFEKNSIKTNNTIINLGTDTEKFKPILDKKKAKEKININSNQTIIGYHGRIGREKNLITLYRAFRKLEKKYNNIKLLIVGSGVKDQENIFSSNRNIILTGKKEDVIPYLQAMDIYVLPSLTETSSLSTMEAMSCGLAVITTPVGYVKEYINEKENGMFFPFKNSTRLYMKLDLLIQDLALRKRLGKNARKTIIEKFNWDNTYSKIKNTINSF